MAREIGIRLIPVPEISAFDNTWGDLHVVGCPIGYKDPVMREHTQRGHGRPEPARDAILSRLRQLGFSLDESEVERRRAEAR